MPLFTSATLFLKAYNDLIRRCVTMGDYKRDLEQDSSMDFPIWGTDDISDEELLREFEAVKRTTVPLPIPDPLQCFNTLVLMDNVSLYLGYRNPEYHIDSPRFWLI